MEGMDGRVKPGLRPVIVLELVKFQGDPFSSDIETLTTEAVVDTGFTEELMVDVELLAKLEWHPGDYESLMTTDGPVPYQTYKGEVIWHGRRRAVLAYGCKGVTLIGMSLLEKNRLWINVIVGDTVAIDPLR